MKTKSLLSIIVAAGALSFTSVNASLLVFDNGAGSQKGSGIANGPNDVKGNDPIKFVDSSGQNLDVVGSQSKGKNRVNAPTFNHGNDLDWRNYAAYQDLDRNHGGLGVVHKNYTSGADDSLESNEDEVVFFKFAVEAILNKVFFNGDHKPTVDTGNAIGANAVFNIFHSTDNVTYTSIYPNIGPFFNSRVPDSGESLSVNAGAFQYWAVSATGYGSHASYIEAIDYDVPEPSIIALFGLGLFGLGFASRRRA
jgi:hypothetical protein